MKGDSTAARANSAVAAESPRALSEPLRVDQYERLQFLSLRPEWMEFGVGQFLAGDAAGDADAAEAERLDRVLDLFRGKIRLAGGGALLPGLAFRLEAAADVPVVVVEDPLECVIRGAAQILEHGTVAKAR